MLEKIRFNPAYPTTTRDGRKVRVVSTTCKSEGIDGTAFPIKVEIETDQPNKLFVANYPANGRWNLCGHDSPNDLISTMPWHLWILAENMQHLKPEES